MRTEIEGFLEIDHESGTVYFTNKHGQTILRIANLPPIPALNQIATKQLDIRVVEETQVNYFSMTLEPEEEIKNSIG